MPKKRVEAVAYLRTSSATNVGADKDSDKRQRDAIRAHAQRAGYELVGEFYDAAVKGADPVQERRFAALLECAHDHCGDRQPLRPRPDCAGDRPPHAQGAGHRDHRRRQSGRFVEDTPTATLVRQVLGAMAQFDKAMTVAKLRLARDRIRKRDGKCEGRKSHAEERPEVVDLVKRLHKQGMSYRAIGAELERAGHVNERGRPFHHKSIRAMLGD